MGLITLAILVVVVLVAMSGYSTGRYRRWW